MIRRLAALLLIALIFLPGCKEEKLQAELSAEDKELLRAKADDTIGAFLAGAVAPFAGLVVFDSDAFLTQSRMLDQANIPVLNVFGNAAILRLKGPELLPLLKERSVKKAYYLCRQGALVRLDPAFEMDLMRRFGEGKEDEDIDFLTRFRDPPDDRDAKLVESAGFSVRARTGLVWVLAGPLRNLPRLLESDRIDYYEAASKARTK